MRETAGRRFAWGHDDAVSVDCYWWLVGWLERSRGPFANGLRAKYFGKYSSALSCRRLADQNGGFRVIVAELAAAAGLTLGDVAAAGDMVVVRSEVEEILGICVGGGRTAALSPVGVAVVARPFMIIWNS